MAHGYCEPWLHPTCIPKVLLCAADGSDQTTCSCTALAQVWVLDSNVGRVRDDARTDVEKVVEEVAAIPLPVPSRKVHNHACAAVPVP